MIDVEIDKLTNSIENAFTGERFLTEIFIVKTNEIIATEWQFDWKREISKTDRQVYKLATKGNDKDHIFMNLVENASFNKGQNKVYQGVAGNLIAFACKISFEKSYDGYVVFDSKTALIQHYQEKLYAKRLGGVKMFIDTQAAFRLLNQYYNE
jgi:hypothetical protein